MQQSETFGVSRRALFLYSALAVATVALPLLLWRLPYPFIRLMDATYHPIPLLQLFVFCAAVALTGVGGYTLYRHWGEHLSRQFPLLLSLLVFFHFLALLRQHAARSWDYHCYEQAAQAIVQGLNPYGNCYLYFPTPAQTLAWLYTVGAYGASLVITDGATKTAQLWDLVFYWYEAMQFLQLILAYALCYRLARRLGLAQGRAGLLVAGLFLFNNPLLATLKHNQVNLWVLNSILLAMLWLPRAPLLSGLCVAFGGHVKIYPLILLLPWILTRQWRALGGAALGMVGVLLVQTKGGQDWQLWQAFLAFAGAFPQGTLFRDNSLHSLVYNSIGHLKWLLGDASYTVNEQLVGRIVLVALGSFGLLYLGRFRQRTQRTATSDGQATATPGAIPTGANSDEKQSCCHVVALSGQHDQTTTRQHDHATLFTSTKQDLANLGHMMDAIALGLLISPVVWEHHYLLTLPLVIWALANQPTVERLGLVALSAFLIFVIPTFDLFPFSYHRLAGLLLLVSLLPPVITAPWAVVRNAPVAFGQSKQTMTYPNVSEL